MRSDDGMMKMLGAGTARARWGYAALLALAFQVRVAWLLLGVWVVWGSAGGSNTLPGHIRVLPAHPDWWLAGLVESAVVALTAVGLARRWRPGWNVFTSAVAGSLAWAVTSALTPNGFRGFLLVFRPVQEILVTTILLACVAVTWRRLGRWTAVPVVALVGGVGAGAVSLLITYTVFGASWPAEWPREMVNEVISVALFAAVVAVLRRMASAAPDGAPGWRSGVSLGTAGLLALTVVHLVAGSVWSGWTTDSLPLLVAAGLLAVLACWALIASKRAPQP